MSRRGQSGSRDSKVKEREDEGHQELPQALINTLASAVEASLCNRLLIPVSRSISYTQIGSAHIVCELPGGEFRPLLFLCPTPSTLKPQSSNSVLSPHLRSPDTQKNCSCLPPDPPSISSQRMSVRISIRPRGQQETPGVCQPSPIIRSSHIVTSSHANRPKTNLSPTVH
ncbi:hypothetical protein K402DRAFT_269048 [Aulographum hederae CBS 113979]|uniref:Uncharacterized protein n=1 Tax=Aulographum hederae CBS 113979 TaxID=1176131 RepID=A0A6G1H8K3_9PEZI|nr:hypothetical protein K402DRAFT_269048 [Aulographum hederae CBS 113979]